MKKSVYIIILIIIAVLAVVLIVREGGEKDTTEDIYQDRQPVLSSREKTSVTVYYFTADGRYLLPFSMDIPATTEDAKVAMEKLLAGPPVADALDVIPQDTKLLNLFIIHDTVYVELTSQFLQMDDQSIEQAVRTIAATVLPLTSCGSFQLLVDGDRLPANLQISGYSLAEPLEYYPVLNLSAEDKQFLIDGGFSEETHKIISYYLPEASGKYLLPFTVIKQAESVADSTAAADAAVREMFTTADREGLYLLPTANITFPQITIKDKVAYCDFAEDLLENYGKESEELFVRCLVRTLTAQGGVTAVQITVNGEVVPQLYNGLEIDHQLTAEEPINQIKNNN